MLGEGVRCTTYRGRNGDEVEFSSRGVRSIGRSIRTASWMVDSSDESNKGDDREAVV